MITVTEEFVERAAPNADAAKNGRALVIKNKFLSLNHSPDNTILFAQCQGSGKVPYSCSADFLSPESPVYRCSCPSRQFPCKHTLGLLYAYAQKRPFTAAEVPEDLAAKRDKAQQRTEKKKEAVETPKKVNKSALAKKIKMQLGGIDLLESLTLDLVKVGIGNMNAKSADIVETQAKQLANAYLPGAQAALHNYTRLFTSDDRDGQPASQRDANASEAIDQLGRLHAIIKQGRAYLTKRLDDPELGPETESSIAAWLGHSWQLRELKDVGLVETDVELVQLAFNSHDDVARKEYVDTGVWMNLRTGRIQLTQTFRPYKAAKRIASEDSFFDVMQVPELCVYPGDVNPRIRWDGSLSRPLTVADLQQVRALGAADFKAVIKDVKSHLKAPLADKFPIYALNYKRIGQIDSIPVVEDGAGERLVLTDAGLDEEPPSCHLFGLLPKKLFSDQTLIVRFRHDLDRCTLEAKPLSIVTETNILRLTL